MKRLIAAYARQPGNLRGAFWMLLSALTFTVMTTLIKYLGDDYPAALQTFYRQLAGMLVMLPIILHSPRTLFRTSRPGLVLFRSLGGTVGMILAFYAYQKMPLADANALSFTRALWLVPLAIFFLGEKVGVRRLSATVVGFLGVLLMVQPTGSDGFMNWPAAAALSSSFLFALIIVGIKVMTRDHTTTQLMAWSAVLGLVLSVPPALFVWAWPTLPDLFLLSLMGVMGILTQWCYLMGMARGDAAVMAPIDYSRLIFAVILGFMLFGDVPGLMTMVGALVVIVSTLYITLRESYLKRRAAKPPDPPMERTD